MLSLQYLHDNNNFAIANNREICLSLLLLQMCMYVKQNEEKNVFRLLSLANLFSVLSLLFLFLSYCFSFYLEML